MTVGRRFSNEKDIEANLLEELSKIEHDQWIEWSKSVAPEVSEERRERWQKYWVDYEDLSEDVKEQDRVYARKVLDAVDKHTKEKEQTGCSQK